MSAFPHGKCASTLAFVATNARLVGPLTLMVGAQIRSERFSRDMGQAQLAAAAEISVPTISKMENGQAAIDVEQLQRIAAAFKLSPEELINRARRSATAAEITLYREDGSLDPEQTRTIPAEDAAVAAALQARSVAEGTPNDG